MNTALFASTAIEAGLLPRAEWLREIQAAEAEVEPGKPAREVRV